MAIAIPAGSASADDRRPCVSLREFNHLEGGLQKWELERLWEVHGLGWRYDYTDAYRTLVYPACGYRTDVDVARAGYVLISYNWTTKRWLSAFRYVGPEAQPHGHI